MTKWICTDPKARPTGSEVLELYCIPQVFVPYDSLFSWWVYIVPLSFFTIETTTRCPVRQPERGKPRACTELVVTCSLKAGMGAWAFHSWTGKLGPEISILPVEVFHL